MKSRLILVGACSAALACGIHQVRQDDDGVPSAAALLAPSRAATPERPGVFPAVWNSGVDCDSEPAFQVHAYNDDFYIIRQSKCFTHEAPFLFLIFGGERALLLDTGSSRKTDLWGTVDQVVQAWLARNGRSEIRLVVAHSHGHGDHVQGDEQFEDRPYVDEVVGVSLRSVEEFWGFQDYPRDTPTLDLGGRVLDVLGTPGHHPVSVTLYDRETQLLLSGDIVYPGHLFIFSPADWPVFQDSLLRMAVFATQNPVEWVLGCHIEYSDQPMEPYAWGTRAHPTEHELQLPVTTLRDILRGARAMGATPEGRIFEHFVIHPVHLCGITWNG